MKDHIRSAHMLFVGGCDRAGNLKAIHDFLKKSAAAALNCDDILRSALVLAVSSFDLFLHNIFRMEVLYRLSTKQTVGALRVPFDVLHLEDDVRISKIEECIRKDNSYKSFVAPDKMADCLRPLIESPWDVVAVKIGEDVSSCKLKLKGVVDLRNRIAHEADVNPEYGGLDLWPIHGEDVENSILFLRRLGVAVAHAVDCS